MKRHHVLIAIAISLLIALAIPQLTAARDIKQGTGIPPTAVATAGAKNFLTQGDQKFDRQDYAGAIEDYTQAIRLNPDDDIAYFKRGLARSAPGNYSGAIEDYNKAIRLNPKNDQVYVSRGSAHLALKQDRAALDKLVDAMGQRFAQQSSRGRSATARSSNGTSPASSD